MRCLRYAGLSFLLWGSPLLAQQVKFIDLTTIPQRVELRYPPASPNQNRGYGGGSGGECGVDARDPRSLTVYLLSVIASDGDPSKPFEVEFKVLNTGRVPLELPVSPHLSDLQPKDASTSFTYTSLALAVSPAEDHATTGFVELYGKADAPDTLITLNPGEWLRVEAKVDFHLRLPPGGSVNLVPVHWLHRVTFHPHPGGFTSDAENVCMNEAQAPPLRVHRN